MQDGNIYRTFALVGRAVVRTGKPWRKRSRMNAEGSFVLAQGHPSAARLVVHALSYKHVTPPRTRSCRPVRFWGLASADPVAVGGFVGVVEPVTVRRHDNS